MRSAPRSLSRSSSSSSPAWAGLELLELLDKLRGAERIGNVQFPAHRVGREIGPQRLNRRPAVDLDFTLLLDEIPVEIEEPQRALLLLVLPTRLTDGVFAVVAQRFAMRDGVVPDKAAGRVGQRVHPAVRSEERRVG